MKKLSFPESGVGKPSQFAAECWFDDACILDMDYFVKTLAGIKAKGVSPDLIGSIITHYASKWLPELAAGGGEFSGKSISGAGAGEASSPESVTAAWMKKRFFVETLVGVLPPERDSVPCDFLLRLLRTAAMVGAEAPYRAELERRVAWMLEQASLGELMIPSFSHTCGTLLDVEMVRRLVERFVGIDEAAGRGGAALVKVARLVDCYLAEAAVDADLTVAQFVALAGALPGHARSMDDGLYRAVDTYLKAHPGVSKQDRKTLCRLIDSQKLSPEASFHAAQNERLPIRAVIQVLFSEQTKLNRHIDWSGSFSGQRSPNPIGPGLDHPSAARCHSKREVIAAQQNEIRKLRDDVIKLQSQVTTLQLHMERLVMREKKKSKKGFFRWNKLGLNLKSSVSVVEEGEIDASGEVGFGRLTPIDGKPKLMKGRTPPKLRKSMS